MKLFLGRLCGYTSLLDPLTEPLLGGKAGGTLILVTNVGCMCVFSRNSSMVIRDLTLRSAASFGSFHLIRLLYDEYMFYLVEHRVAQATGETPIAVMGEVREAKQPGLTGL